ncbi:ATPase AAA [Planctomycetales bacterium 10988]|nr:ATPase AAA [Planctomycetales bacterium 10988]
MVPDPPFTNRFSAEEPPLSQSEEEIEAIQRCEQEFNDVRDELAKVIVGQNEVVEQVLVAMFARGHALLEGVPGLAKTLLVSSLAKTLALSFKRIQFTPDLMPSDVTGTEIIQEDLETGKRHFEFLAGPLFANLLLADEINRTPPKTQAAMLEAMQERQISIGGKTHALPDPFFVLATQNPLEQEGTYPLPEAQLDRFLLYIRVNYPSGSEEWEIARRVSNGQMSEIVPQLNAEKILKFQQLVQSVPVSDQVLGYAWSLVRSSRPQNEKTFDFIQQWVRWGAGPRGLLALLTCAKARAILYGRYHASVGDIQAVAYPALRHRIATNFAAQAHQIDSDKIIEMLLEAISPEQAFEQPIE